MQGSHQLCSHGIDHWLLGDQCHLLCVGDEMIEVWKGRYLIDLNQGRLFV